MNPQRSCGPQRRAFSPSSGEIGLHECTYCDLHQIRAWSHLAFKRRFASTLQWLKLDRAVLGYLVNPSVGAYEHMSCTEHELDVQNYY